ncbi:hypothetical protein [Pontibacter fetidus]|uniref:Uncharacterized protein n=1 Tax=Pontibacter fetidus TaxID=2700082 RepID=A0A6B2GWT8_9BACT|nr:hypothetical protein [Pontibacter fetidus]NDK55399.1 hypothetical protein [Pontibacter fetidus]
MNLKRLLFSFCFTVLCWAGAMAQNCDPWIVQIYKQQYNAVPTAEECNIRNYNNGSWNSYEELTGYIRNYKNRQAAAKPSVTPAQNCDPWIVQIYQQEYRRNPTAEECNIRNYNNGSWGSYADLTTYIKAYQTKNSSTAKASVPATTVKLEGDPWIFKAYRELYRREPVALELNVNNYNGGSWASYAQLKRFVAEFQNSLKNHNAQIKTVDTANGNQLTGLYLNGEQVAVALISKNGGGVVAAGGMNVVSAGGANVVAAGGMNVISPGGGNVVSAGGANVVSAGGANVVSAGGANISMHQNMAGLSFGGRYSVQSAGTKVIPTSGKSALIIR